MLNVQNLTVDYGKARALQGVDLSIKEEAITFIVGPNGAGKSTILRTLAGLKTPSNGSIRFGSADTAGVATEDLCRQGLVLIPEGRHIFGNLTVSENLSLGASGRKDKQSLKNDTDAVMDLFPILAERINGNAGKLSGGEQQQLAIARAILQQPKLLMIDEPSLGLAPIVIDQVYDALKRLNDMGLTLMIVEQQINRIMSIADHIYILRHGRVAFSEKASEIQSAQVLEDAYFGYADEDAAH